MSDGYKIRDQTLPHFVTATVVDWVDLPAGRCFYKKKLHRHRYRLFRFLHQRKGNGFVWLCDYEQSYSYGSTIWRWRVIGFVARFQEIHGYKNYRKNKIRSRESKRMDVGAF